MRYSTAAPSAAVKKSNATGVTLAYNVKGGIQFAQTLYELGRLRQFYSPLLLKGPLRELGPHRLRKQLRRVSKARQWKRPADMPVHPLIASDLAFRVPIPSTIISWPRRIQIAQGLADASLLISKKTGSSFWFDSGMALHSAKAMKRRGAFIVVGRRALHHSVESDLVQKLSGQKHYQHPEAALSRRLNAEYQLCDLILCNSQLTRRSFLERDFDESKLHVITNAVDLQVFTPASDDSVPNTNASDYLKVLYVGTIDTRKNVVGLVTACAATAGDIELTLVGRDVEGLSATLMDILPTCKFLGLLPTASLVTLYRQADLLVLPSFADAYGLVAAEAMAVGTPVIVTDTCGVSQVVQDGRHGYVIQAGNHDHLVATLDHLLDHRDLLDRMRTALIHDRFRLGHELRREQIVNFINSRLPP